MNKLKQTILYQLFPLLALLLVLSSEAFAGTISITQVSDNVFGIDIRGFTGPAGFQLMLSYDSSRFSNPRVTLGNAASGAMIAANPNVAGSLHVALVKMTPMSGDGRIATLTFDRLGDAASAIKFTQVSVIDAGGKKLAANSVDWNPPEGGASDTQTAQATGGGGGDGGNKSGTSAPYVLGGTVTLPTDDQGSREHKDSPAGQSPAEPKDAATTATVPAVAGSSEAGNASAEAQQAAKKAPAELPKPGPSVLEKFRLFTGERTPKNLLALFERDADSPVVQSPPVAIADGKGSVKLTVSKLQGDSTPNFTFTRARYLSLKQTGDGEWQIEVIPEKDALYVGVNIMRDDAQVQIPLTVSPAAAVDLNKSGRVSEDDFQLFLKTRGTESQPKYDLNGDGKRDYIDDFIFAVNYLVKLGSQPPLEKRKEAPPKKP